MHRPALNGDRGITLVEVMVAVLILSLGTVAGFRSLDAARLSIGGAQDRLFAMHVAQNRAAEIRVQGRDGLSLPETVAFADAEWRVSVTTEPTLAGFSELTIRASGPRGTGASLVMFLPPEDE